MEFWQHKPARFKSEVSNCEIDTPDLSDDPKKGRRVRGKEYRELYKVKMVAATV